MTMRYLENLLAELIEFGPNLKLFEAFGQSITLLDMAFINISALNFDKIPRGTYLKTRNAMLVYKPWIGDKFQIVEMRMNAGDRKGNGYVDVMFDV